MLSHRKLVKSSLSLLQYGSIPQSKSFWAEVFGIANCRQKRQSASQQFALFFFCVSGRENINYCPACSVNN